ncbi:MAG: ThiF family adenylyltransferase [Bacteroidales bacterium]|jgi:tRNA A37 threonylcarbamoyladenosine dehydratase|nr:ThiF family adenylyltransferase [Bacteroidales bacterium]
MKLEDGIFRRSSLLLGNDFMQRIKTAKVIIFGIGGVGGWCAESLVRSGVQHLTVVDSDRICVTNINRQVMATCKTVGQIKVEALKKRLLDINPGAQIEAIQQIYSKETRDMFHLETYDYIIDAIDSLSNKIDLILTASQMPAVFFSSMGAALKIDASKIRVAEFWKVKGCPFAALIRKKMRRTGYPAKKFLTVFSDEVLPNRGENLSCGSPQCLCPKVVPDSPDDTLANHEWCSAKARINGTSTHITAIFGFTLAGLVVQDITAKIKMP